MSERSLAWHREHGGYHVVYPDGRPSQPFTFEVARQYAIMFGGSIRRYRRPRRQGFAVRLADSARCAAAAFYLWLWCRLRPIRSR